MNNNKVPRLTDITLPCPRHEGSYDCSPFCDICEGEQEFTRTPADLNDIGRWMLALKVESVYKIAEHLEKDYGLLHNLDDDLTRAIRELKQELTTIITKREL